MSETRFEGLPQMQNNSLINISQVYESLRYNDYSVENGLGEIVDNSVEAGASEIRVYFTKKITRLIPDQPAAILPAFFFITVIQRRRQKHFIYKQSKILYLFM